MFLAGSERRSARWLGLLAAVLILATSCGESTIVAGSDSGEDARGLSEREFWATEVVDAGHVRDLVPGTRITLSFSTDTIGASAGCNSMGGAYSIDGDALIVGGMGMTEMGCDAGRHQQDEFLATFLGESPSLTLDGDQLILTSGESVITLLDASVANPDRPIIGTNWDVDGFIDGDVAMAFATDAPGTLVFTDESTMTAFDGCRNIEASVEVSNGSTGGPVEGDGEIQFGPIEPGGTENCENPDYAEAFNALFDTGDATFTIDGTNLTILNRDGVGITLRVARSS
ncbi:MAG: heat shock protein HslJ [Verrucomicrobiales bacterium]|jgi:heat shock protein HslJ